MFYRIFGKNGYGKTHYIFDKLAQCVNNRRKAFLIVPEQCAVEAEKLVIRKLGAKSNLYIEVINFKRLCNRVFRTLGGLTSVHLDEGARKMLMLLTLDKIAPLLKEYKDGADLEDFCEKAISTYNLLKASGVSPSSLEKAAEKISALSSGADCALKLYDIALICSEYSAKLDEVCEQDADMYSKLCTKLSESPFFEDCDVFLDSFYGFTSQEFEIISHIAEQADNTYVTFSCEKSEHDPMFKRSTDAAKKCLKLAEKCGCTLQDIELTENMRHKTSTALFAFEENFRSEKLGCFEKVENCDSTLVPVLCSDIHREVRFACAKIHSLIREGARYRDITVCARNTSDYMGIIDTAFEKAGIPAGFDIPQPLNQSALYELIVCALEGANKFICEDVIRYIKTGLSGLDEEEADTLETYLRVWNISPTQFKKDSDFVMNPDGYVDTDPDGHTLDIVNSARSKVFICLDSLHSNLACCRTVEDYCTAVYNLLCDITKISGKDEIYDGADGEALELLCDMLDSFVKFSGNEKITAERFITLFKSCSKSYEYAHIPSKSDEVRFSDVSLMRASNTKYIIILGVNSSIFPKGASDTGLIGQSERNLLSDAGIELGDNLDDKVFDELFLAYSAVSSASKGCFALYSEKNLSGESLYPSVIVSAIEKITGNEPVRFNENDIEQSFAGNDYLFDELSLLPKGEKRNALIRYFSSLDSYSQKLDALLGSFSQSERLEAQTLRLIYGNTLITSYSRLEKFRACPFSHFCSYTLKLKPEPVASLGPAEAGTVMHSVLEHLVPILCKEDEKGNYPDEEKAKQLVKQLLSQELLSISRTEQSELPKRFVYLYGRLSRLLETLACNIVRELKVTKFKPCDFELNISSGNAVPPAPIDIGGGCTLYIVGQIDRVDVYSKDNERYIRIIDYKTGKKSFKMKDILKGFNLQMLLYLEAIRQKGQDYYGGKIIPSAVLYSNVISSIQTLSLGDDIKEAADELTSPASSGVFLDDEEILFAMDSSENKMYLPITSKNSEDTLKSLEDMGKLLDFATTTAADLAREIRSGLKSVTPFDGKSEGIDIDPCSYCEMRTICGVE